MCEPLKLFGGIVNIPFWGLRNISCAMADIMISDLPHIEYDTKEHINKEDVDNAISRTKDLQNRTSKKGLGINIKNTVSLSSIISKDKQTMNIQQAKSMASKYKNGRLI